MASIELAIGPGEESGSCRVQVLESDDGLASAEVSLDVASLSARRRELEKAVIASAGPNPTNPSSTNPLREIGQTLFSALLGSADIAGRYAVSVAKAREEGQGLRVVLRIDTPELARLPWESMYDTGRGAYVCRRDQLVRRVPASGAARLKVQPPLRILGVVSAPGDRKPLNVEQEKQRLTQALSAPSEKGLIALHWAPQATWQALQSQLAFEGPWHVLHFIGHGSFDRVRDQGVLDLTGADGNAHPVVADDLVDLLGQGGRMPSLVVLNSCEGAATAADDLFAGTAYALVRGGVSAVAAMQYSISDSAASAFTQGFYDAIAGGLGVDEATRNGRIAILGTRGTLEWVTPVMYLRGNETHLFDLESPSANGPNDAMVAKTPVIPESGPAINDSGSIKAPPAPSTSPPVTGRDEWQIIDRSSQINAISWDPDGRRVAVACNDATVSTEQIDGKQPKEPLEIRDDGGFLESPWIIDVAFSPLGDRLATASSYADSSSDNREQGAVKVWDTADGNKLLHIGRDLTTAVAFNVDGTRLATAGGDNIARSWNVAEASPLPLRRFSHDGVVTAVAFNVDGTRLVTGSADYTARIWNAASGQQSRLFRHDEAVTAVALSADGTRLATGCADHLARIWNVNNRKLLSLRHDGAVTAVSFNVDGTRLASGSADHTVKIWDVADGRLLELLRHDAAVSAVAFSRDGTQLATVSADNRALIWDVTGL